MHDKNKNEEKKLNVDEKSLNGLWASFFYIIDVQRLSERQKEPGKLIRTN